MADETHITHECSRCRRSFRDAYNLHRHQVRKTPCVLILEPEEMHTAYGREVLKELDLEQKKCRFCGRVFSSYTGMRRHVRNNCKIALNAKNGNAGMKVLYEHTIQKQGAQLKAQQVQITNMLGVMQRLEGLLLTQKAGGQNAGEVVIQGNENRVTVDNHKIININVFGQEGLNHATTARIKSILDESLITQPTLPEAAQRAVIRTALLVYSDPDHPENITAYLPNKKTNDVLVHAKDGWEVQPASLVLSPMAQKSIDTLFDRQPYENAKEYGPLMKELAESEKQYTGSKGTVKLRPILVRNKELLMRELESLPITGRAAS